MRLLSYVTLFAVMLGGCAEKKAAVIQKPPPPLSRPRPVKKEPPPPTILSPRVGREEEDRLKQDAKSRIEEAERIVKQIDQHRLAEEQRGTFSTIQSFLSKAREALSFEDFLRAFNLADKAQILAQELLNSSR
ncbi:MAG: hypothetical protein HYY12_05520 [Candidatus Methylomirabilis oxyfera]|nr:hypothetical protein [Candidatus Methylomirabilis oxyfera]